jgi:hypothetical protein
MYKTFLPMTNGRLHPMPQSQAIAKTLIETRMKDRIELDFLRNEWLLLFGWSGFGYMAYCWCYYQLRICLCPLLAWNVWVKVTRTEDNKIVAKLINFNTARIGLTTKYE